MAKRAWGESFDGGQADSPAKQTEIDHLCNMLADYAQRNGELPQPMPLGHRDAATWWMSLLPPRKDREHVQKTTYGEIDPYVSRLKGALAGFLGLPDVESRRAVLALMEGGLEYRGDALEDFERIYNEREKMREMGTEAYIGRVRALAGRLVGG